MDEKNDLINALLKTYHLLHRYHMLWYGKNFGGLDPQQGQGRILTTLQRRDNLTQKELGSILNFRSQSLGELLKKLESSGYIRRKRSTMDKRALIVSLTEQGKNFRLQEPNYDEIFTNFTSGEKEIFKWTLEKISAQLADQIKSEIEDEYY